jgi:hypothetical protein
MRSTRGAFALVLVSVVAGCTSSPSDPLEPTLTDVATVTFVDGVDNPYFPLPVGMTWAYEAQSEEGLERIEIEVLAIDAPGGDKVVQGVRATVVRDVVYLDGEVIEDTFDWYAQDADGNVWYLGEDTCEWEPGTYDPDAACVAPVGAWEWGVGGALPGIVMPADPQVDGRPYYQEYYVGEAEDVGEVVEVGLTVEVAAGTFEDCIKTHDTSTLDPDLDEYKYYCPGIGTVLVEEPDITEELVEHAP